MCLPESVNTERKLAKKKKLDEEPKNQSNNQNFKPHNMFRFSRDKYLKLVFSK